LSALSRNPQGWRLAEEVTLLKNKLARVALTVATLGMAWVALGAPGFGV
jgi:hypothetical protein